MARHETTWFAVRKQCLPWLDTEVEDNLDTFKNGLLTPSGWAKQN